MSKMLWWTSWESWSSRAVKDATAICLRGCGTVGGGLRRHTRSGKLASADGKCIFYMDDGRSD
jgi:hypothetical protein